MLSELRALPGVRSAEVRVPYPSASPSVEVEVTEKGLARVRKLVAGSKLVASTSYRQFALALA